MESGALRDLNLPPPLSPRFETPCPNLPFSPPPPLSSPAFVLLLFLGKFQVVPTTETTGSSVEKSELGRPYFMRKAPDKMFLRKT